MSISLKTMNANEILESMADSLNDKEFMGLYKKAELGDDWRPHKSPSIPTRLSMQELYNIARTHLDYKGSDETVNDFIEFSNDKLAQDKAKKYAETHLQKAEDTEQMADTIPPSTMEYSPKEVQDMKEKLQKEIDEKAMEDARSSIGEIPVAQNTFNKADDVALAYTIKNLTKLANALDVNGYSGLANVVDEAINKAASLKK